MTKEVKSLEEMPGALSYLIAKVENLEETVQSLRYKQQASNLPHWMDIDELCSYIPSYPVKQTVYGLYPTSRFRTIRLTRHWHSFSLKSMIG